jgi:hypothetical protein
VAGSCECGNKFSGSIKCGEFLEESLAYQEGLYFMEVVN